MVIAVLIVLGLCFGSFINALVWRLHEQSLPKKQRVASAKDLSITQGRSMCPNCQHTLGVLDLLPLVSWLALQGRCRYCKHPIGWQYPLVEATTAVLYVTSYLVWPYELTQQGIFLLVCWLIALIGLIALVIYDVRWMLLPNKIVFPLIGLGVVQAVGNFVLFGAGISYLLGVLASVAVAGGLFYVLYQLSDGRWIGGGDVKLGYVLGMFLATPLMAGMMLFVASLLGLLAALPGLATRRLAATSRIPFGPFLIAATIIIVLVGTVLFDSYNNLMLQLLPAV